MAVFKDYLSHLPVSVRSTCPRDSLLLDRLPAVVNCCLGTLPQIKSSNPQLMRPEDKKRLGRVVQVLLDEGIHLRQSKLVEMSSYKFSLDPPIDLIVSSDGSQKGFSVPDVAQDSHTYALCRLIGNEMETRRIRQLKPIATSKSNTNTNPNPNDLKRHLTAATLPAAKKVARDFFGRPIVAEVEPENTNNNNDGDEQPLPIANLNVNDKMTIWYVQNDGVSNAVRRCIKVSNFMS